MLESESYNFSFRSGKLQGKKDKVGWPSVGRQGAFSKPGI